MADLQAGLQKSGVAVSGIGRTPAARRSAERGFELQHIRRKQPKRHRADARSEKERRARIRAAAHRTEAAEEA